jgi:uncharacterized protein
MESMYTATQELFAINAIPEHHGYGHVKDVHDEAEKACRELTDTHYTYKGKRYLRKKIVFAIRVAALSHDDDDDKLFGDTSGTYPNVTAILNTHLKHQGLKPLILDMITLVPASKNGNTIRGDLKDSLWMYIPQNADRNAANGWIGIKRCYQYSRSKDRPLYTNETPLPLTLIDLETFIDPKRFEEYSTGKRHESGSTFDHFYDKLFHIGALNSGNVYLQSVATARTLIMKQWIVTMNNLIVEHKLGPYDELIFDDTTSEFIKSIPVTVADK